MEDKTKEELIEEIKVLKTRLAELKEVDSQYKALESELQKAREDVEIEAWGLAKTNEAIKFLYKELDNKNRELQTLDKLKTDFINTASHELRTPLTIIKEAISQVLDGLHGAISAEQRDFLSICYEDAERLNRLVDELLDVSKIEAGKFKLVKEQADIIDIARGVMASFSVKAKSFPLDLRSKFDQKELLVYLDKDSIIRVFTNLIGNAFKFTDKGFIEVSIKESAERVECSIADTGKGISEDDLSKAFGKFQQFSNVEESRGERGTGLGLNISKSIIELHGGEIWVESALNKGTRFTFTIPKLTEGQIKREYVLGALQEAIKEKTLLSILSFYFNEFDAHHTKIGDERMNSILRNLEDLIKENLRFQIDIAVRNPKNILAVLFDTDKARAAGVAQIILKDIKDYLSEEKIGLQIFCKVVSYPEDGSTEEEIAEKIDVQM